MKNVELKGIIVPIVTPMYPETEDVNIPELRNQIERQIAGGVHGIFTFGTNGEGYILSMKEKEEVLEAAIDQVKGRVPVYAGTGCISTRDTIYMSKRAEEMGADVLSIITPSFAAASQMLLCKQAAKNFHTICKKETALKRVLSNLLSAVSLLRFKAVFSCGFRVPPGSGLYQSCAAGSVCIPAGQKYCSPRPRKSCPADRKTPGLPSRCIGHRW